MTEEPAAIFGRLPLRYIAVVRRTHTTLDVLLEIRNDDDWNVDGVPGSIGAMDRIHAVHNVE